MPDRVRPPLSSCFRPHRCLIGEILFLLCAIGLIELAQRKVRRLIIAWSFKCKIIIHTCSVTSLFYNIERTFVTADTRSNSEIYLDSGGVLGH